MPSGVVVTATPLNTVHITSSVVNILRTTATPLNAIIIGATEL